MVVISATYLIFLIFFLGIPKLGIAIWLTLADEIYQSDYSTRLKPKVRKACSITSADFRWT